MLNSIAHVGIVVKDLEQAAELYRRIFGAEVLPPLATPDMKLAMVRIGSSYVELMQPTSDKGPIRKFLAEHGEGVQHICFEVDNIEDTLKSLAEKGIELIDQKPRQGVQGKIAFLHPGRTNRVLIELEQKE